MKPNGQVPYVSPNGTLTIAGMRLLENNGRVLPPVLTTAQRAVYAPLPGEVIYNASTGKLNYWNGVTEAWEAITSA